ncbi:unnamed protein product [Toxocara canis]|nr:unnamed protein product [Toxocara canis]
MGAARNPDCPPPPPPGPRPPQCSPRRPVAKPSLSEESLCTSTQLRSVILKNRGEDTTDTIKKIYDAAKEVDNEAIVTVLCAPASTFTFKVQSSRYCVAGSAEFMCFVSLA